MADPAVLNDVQALAGAGYQVAVGAWVQLAPELSLTTRLNAFNTLGQQDLTLQLFDNRGNLAGRSEHVVKTFETLRLDLETIVDPGKLPFEGALWSWGKGQTPEGNLNFQGIDLDFINRQRPAGHVMGSVHLITDFSNTLGIGPYVDLLGPRIIMEATPEGGQRYQNFLGLAFAPTNLFLGSTPNAQANLVVTVTNQAGETMTAPQPLAIPPLGSWFGDLAFLFPGLEEFLAVPGQARGFGAIGVQEAGNALIGVAGMVKVRDTLSGELMVSHLNDRHFSRPAQKSVS